MFLIKFLPLGFCAVSDWCEPLQSEDNLIPPSKIKKENEWSCVDLRPLSVSLWRIPNIKIEVSDRSGVGKLNQSECSQWAEHNKWLLFRIRLNVCFISSLVV